MTKTLYKPLDTVLVRTPLFAENKTLRDTNLEDCAIAVGSQSLFTRKNLDTEKTRAAIRRYSKRMQHRATPYGMFAGVSLGRFGDSTDLCRGSMKPFAHTRPDMSLLMPALRTIESRRSARVNLKWFPNPELVIKSDRVWIERPTQGDGHGINVRSLKSVLRALELSRSGIAFGRLVQTLCLEFRVTHDEAEKLCHKLCDHQILVSELRFALCDWKKVPELLGKFSEANSDQATETKIRDLFQRCSDWDAAPTAQGYIALSEKAACVLSTDNQNLLQTDCTFNLSGETLNWRVGQELAMAAELLLRISTVDRYDSQISYYRNRFLEEYQSGREVPLLELLSPRFGIGSPYDGQGSYSASHHRDAVIMDLLTNAAKENSLSIELGEEHINQLQTWEPNAAEAPLSVQLFASISAESREAIDNGEFSVLIAPRTGDNGAGRAMGRFASILGEDAITSLKDLASAEQRLTSNLLVDLNYWPRHPRSGNVAISPAIRRHSVTSTCSSPIGSEEIPLQEINIGVSEDRFYARWIRTGQLISAKSNSLLTSQGIPEALRFLLDIDEYGKPKLWRFDWGLASRRVFLPRLTVGRTILSPARWLIRTLSMDTISDFKEALTEFRNQFGVPRLVNLVSDLTDDNTLLLDLENDEDLSLLFSSLRKGEYVNPILTEHISSSKWHVSEDSNFCTEIVASFILQTHDNREDRALAAIDRRQVQHSDYMRLPGSEWIYLKMPANKDFHEELIVGANQFARKLIDEKILKQWFFVRYAESYKDQLRIRFRRESSPDAALALVRILDWAGAQVSRGLCRSFEIASYDREVERYGGPLGMDVCEDFFYADSVYVADMLQLVKSCRVDPILVSIKSTNSILSSLGLSNVEKIEWLSHSIGSEHKDLISSQYRFSKKAISDWLMPEEQVLPQPQIQERISVYEREIEPLSQRLLSLKNKGQLLAPFMNVGDSLIHLNSVRFFGLDRKSETLVRGLLSKGLISQVKRRG